MKYLFIVCLLALSACSPNKGSLDTGSETPGTTPSPAPAETVDQVDPPALTVRMQNQTWEMKSALAVERFGFVTLFLMKDEGLTCKDYQKLAQMKNYVMITLPSKVQKLDLQDVSEMAQQRITGAFYESQSQAFLIDRLTVEIKSNDSKTIAGEIKAQSSSANEAIGSFAAQICSL